MTPRRIEPGDLLLGEDHDFVVNAYLALLRRWPDEGGFRHYLRVVAQHPERRVDALREMAESEESRRAGPLVVLPADDADLIPSPPARAQAAMLALRTEALAQDQSRMREALELLTGEGRGELAGLGAELMEQRDAELRSEINLLRREMRQRLDAMQEMVAGASPVAAAAPAQPDTPALVEYLGELLAITEARLEARLRGIEARLLALTPPSP